MNNICFSDLTDREQDVYMENFNINSLKLLCKIMYGELRGLADDFDIIRSSDFSVQHHWAGRNTRGVTQFIGAGLKNILDKQENSYIDKDKAVIFLNELISR